MLRVSELPVSRWRTPGAVAQTSHVITAFREIYLSIVLSYSIVIKIHTRVLKPNFFFNTNKESSQLLVHGYHEYLYKNAVKILINIYRYVSLVSAGRTHM